MKRYFIIWKDGRVSEIGAKSKKELYNLLRNKGFSKKAYSIE